MAAGNDIGSGLASSLTGRRTAAQPFHHGAARRVGEGAEQTVERLVKHVPNYHRADS
jgi:hypothetical protein